MKEEAVMISIRNLELEFTVLEAPPACPENRVAKHSVRLGARRVGWVHVGEKNATALASERCCR